MSIPTETIKIQNSTLEIQNSDQSLAEKGFYWREKDNVRVLICRALEEAGFINGFSTRTGGVSPFPANDLNLAGFDDDSKENIFENRRRFLRALGAENYLLTAVWQIHSDLVRTVKTIADAEDEKQKFDAIVSNLPKILAGVKTADCVPVLLGDAKTGAFAAIHAGWRGTVDSIVPKAIEKMRAEFGTNPADLTAAIGPAATNACYEVGSDVIELFRQNFPETFENLFAPTRDGHALIDLHRSNREQLENAGVLAENIWVAPFCTMTRTDLFFSYRVEKKKYGKTGRLISVVGKASKA